MNLGQALAGVFGIVAGCKTLKKALSDGGGRELASADVLERGGMRVTTHTIHSLDERIAYIRQMIRKGRDDPRVRKFAVQYLSRKCGKDADEWCVPEKNWEAEIVALFKATRAHVRYVRDTHGKDLYQHPTRTLEFGGGDCDDFCLVLGSMLQAVGYKIRLRVIRTKDAKVTNPRDPGNHIYLLVHVPASAGKAARWVPLDASVNQRPGWEAPPAIVAWKKDFEVP
jgi:transglutaminase-like putative cysteine protease